MIDYFGTKIIAVDHGYGNIKTARTIVQTSIDEYDFAPLFKGDILEYGNKWYCIGVGHKEFIPDKNTDDDYYLLTLAAVAMELHESGIYNANVHLVSGLPLNWVQRQRDEFKKYLTRNENVKFRFNNMEYNIHFVGCTIFPQGYPAIVDHLNELDGTNLLCDIGNGTVNILYIQDGKPVESKRWSEVKGVKECMKNVQSAISDKFSKVLDEPIVESIFRTGKSKLSAECMEVVEHTIRTYISDLFTMLRKYNYDPDLMHLYIVGGGGHLVERYGKGLYDVERVTIIKDVNAAAKGFERLANTIIRSKSQQI